MGVGNNSAAYCRPTLADIFRQNRESTDIVSFAATEKKNDAEARSILRYIRQLKTYVCVYATHSTATATQQS